nr:hypothetical protein [Tanacetum cinerariifolium]GFA48968.1 hypothetical protein [Tanacetum cinerariifolium]
GMTLVMESCRWWGWWLRGDGGSCNVGMAAGGEWRGSGDDDDDDDGSCGGVGGVSVEMVTVVAYGKRGEGGGGDRRGDRRSAEI